MSTLDSYTILYSILAEGDRPSNNLLNHLTLSCPPSYTVV